MVCSDKDAKDIWNKLGRMERLQLVNLNKLSGSEQDDLEGELERTDPFGFRKVAKKFFKKHKKLQIGLISPTIHQSETSGDFAKLSYDNLPNAIQMLVRNSITDCGFNG